MLICFWRFHEALIATIESFLQGWLIIHQKVVGNMKRLSHLRNLLSILLLTTEEQLKLETLADV